MYKQIQTAIQQLAGTHAIDNVYLFDAEIVSTNGRIATVQKVGGESSSTIEVRLMASVDDGCLITPTIGSTVIVVGSSNVQPYIAQYSEIDSIEWLGGENDGVPLVKPLLDKINKLENDINTLKNIFTSWVTVPNDGGAALKALTGTWAGQSITPTQQNEIEHTKIKH